MPIRIRADYLIVAAITAFALLVANAGWRGQPLTADLVPQAIAARDLLDHGEIPYEGTLTSFASYTPPGTTWFLAIGALLTHDVSVVQIPGAALLFTVTCIGIFLLARQLFDTRIAIIALALFAFAQIGQFYASSLWQRAHPAFYVWMCYFALLWARKRDGHYLAAALLTYAIGLYVFMELAPAILVIPAAWAYRRPPVKWRSLGIAGIAAVLIWLPYLQFQASRNFIDLRSQLQRVNILPADTRAAYCNPSFTFAPITSYPDDGMRLLLALALTALVALFQRKRLSTWFFLLPFLMLVLITEPGRYERFWWLWAMQVIVLAGILYRRSAKAQVVIGSAMIIAVCCISILPGNAFVGRIKRIADFGIAGPPSPIIVETQSLGEQLQEKHISSASIGYSIPAFNFMADYHAVDAHYKVGMEYDLMLNWEYGVTNTLTCAEGTAPEAAYIISGK